MQETAAVKAKPPLFMMPILLIPLTPLLLLLLLPLLQTEDLAI